MHRLAEAVDPNTAWSRLRMVVVLALATFVVLGPFLLVAIPRSPVQRYQLTTGILSASDRRLEVTIQGFYYTVGSRLGYTFNYSVGSLFLVVNVSVTNVGSQLGGLGGPREEQRYSPPSPFRAAISIDNNLWEEHAAPVAPQALQGYFPSLPIVLAPRAVARGWLAFEIPEQVRSTTALSFQSLDIDRYYYGGQYLGSGRWMGGSLHSGFRVYTEEGAPWH